MYIDVNKDENAFTVNSNRNSIHRRFPILAFANTVFALLSLALLPLPEQDHCTGSSDDSHVESNRGAVRDTSVGSKKFWSTVREMLLMYGNDDLKAMEQVPEETGIQIIADEIEMVEKST